MIFATCQSVTHQLMHTKKVIDNSSLKFGRDRSLQHINFLNPSDFEEIKALVQAIDFNLFEVYCLLDADKVFGFIGVADKKIEMLFLLPEYFGSGYGKMLVTFAVQQLGANKVDVNEQNTKATNFYKHLGFETYERSEKDDQGKNYPLLRMKLR